MLPQRIQEWSLSTCVAEQKNRKSLEVVRSELERAQAALRSLDKQHQDLDALVARAKNATIVHSDDKVSGKSGEPIKINGVAEKTPNSIRCYSMSKLSGHLSCRNLTAMTQ